VTPTVVFSNQYSLDNGTSLTAQQIIHKLTTKNY